MHLPVELLDSSLPLSDDLTLLLDLLVSVGELGNTNRRNETIVSTNKISNARIREPAEVRRSRGLLLLLLSAFREKGRGGR